MATLATANGMRAVAGVLLACAPWLSAEAQQQPRFEPLSDPPAGLSLVVDGDSMRLMVSPPFSSKSLSFIETLAPHCYQPDPAQDLCYVNFMYHGVTSSQYVTRLDVVVDGRLAMRAAGFFQSSFSIPRSHLGDRGIALACGTEGASGDADPLVGLRYAWSVHARDSDGRTSANYGSIGCPVFYPEQIFSDGFEAAPP